jgi:hypothetical protein
LAVAPSLGALILCCWPDYGDIRVDVLLIDVLLTAIEETSMFWNEQPVFGGLSSGRRVACDVPVTVARTRAGTSALSVAD